MSAVELSVVVPCYNEEKNIPLIVTAFMAITAQHSNIEVLLVNNGSTDNSRTVFEQTIQPGTGIRVVTVLVNKGYGYGILAGLNEAKGDLLAWTHADLQTDPLDVLRALEAYQSAPPAKNLLIKGRRTKRKAGEAFFSWGMQVLTNLILKTNLSDINAQPKLFSRAFYEQVKANAPHDFSLDVYFLYHAQKAGVIKTIPVVFAKRLHGEAKGGGSLRTRIKLIRRTFNYLFALRRQLKNENIRAVS
jgi:glycosyltransferase involved in cell wall biosynthesis